MTTMEARLQAFFDGKGPYWRKVLLQGIFPRLSPAMLARLAHALETNDPRIIRGYTVKPGPVAVNLDKKPEAACLIGFCAWQEKGLKTVSEVDLAFSELGLEIEREMVPGALASFTGWFDNEPWEMVRAALLAEVRLEIARREQGTEVVVS